MRLWREVQRLREIWEGVQNLICALPQGGEDIFFDFR